jgi:hypothetical protein
VTTGAVTPAIWREAERHPDGAVTAYTCFAPGPDTLRELMDELFVREWSRIMVGPCLEGAVFEVRFERAPEVRVSDGYLTVDLGFWHFHLCIGPHRGSPSEELRQKRPVARVAFFERRGPGCGGGRSWGLRFWNGYDQQMATVFLPSPMLTDEMQVAKTPDWSRLSLYYRLRERFLGETMPADLEAAAAAPLASEA